MVHGSEPPSPRQHSEYDQWFRPEEGTDTAAGESAGQLRGWFRESDGDVRQGVPHNGAVQNPTQTHAGRQPADPHAAGAQATTVLPTAEPGPAGPGGPAGPNRRPGSGKPKPSGIRRVGRWIKRIFILALVVLLALIGYGIGLAWYTSANINRVDALPEDSIGNTPGSVFLMVGSDSREGAEGLNTGDIEGARTDTIMLLHAPWWGSPTLISLPRDLLVDIPGEGPGKLNSAFADGGPQELVRTVENATGLHVDHYVEVGFNGIVDMTDAVGGVNVCIDYDVDDYRSRLKLKEGCHTIDGETALGFVRMRYSDPKGDLGRIERQQQFLASLLSEATQPATLLNPFTMFDLAGQAADSLTVDQDTGIVNLARFGVAFSMIASGRGESTTVPVKDPAGWYEGESVVIWDEAGAKELFASLGAR